MRTVKAADEPAWSTLLTAIEELPLPAVTIASGRVVHLNHAARGAYPGLAPGHDVRAILFPASPHDAADGRLDGVVAALLVPDAAPTSVEVDVETISARLARLATVTSELLTAQTVEAVSTIITEHLTAAAGAEVGSFSLLVDDDTLALVGLHGGREGDAARWATYPVSARTPVGQVLRSGDVLVLSGIDTIREGYPELDLPADGERSLVVLPLTVTGRTFGGVTLSYAGRREIEGAELQFLRTLADTCAQAITRIQAQEAADDREAQLRFLARASEELASDLDYETTLANVARMAVPHFADWCAIALAEDGRLRTLSVAHVRPEHASLIEELQERYPPDPDAPRGGYQVLRSGASELVADLDDATLVAIARDEEHLRLLRVLEFRSAMAVPLKAGDKALGVITWVTGAGGRRYTDRDLRLGEDLARRAAVAIDNAELHSQLRDSALRLQSTLLPARLPEVAGWEMAVRYLPAGRSGAGGDFYDVVPLADGRLAVFVGDVMGRGVQASATMARMGAALRTLVAVDPDPAVVMRGLDRVFERLGLEELVTVVYAVADPARGEVRVVNAGHPAPVQLSASGAADVMTSPGTLILGAGGGQRGVATRPLRDGDTLLLFTDGLVERRGEDTDVGIARLLARCRDLPGAAELGPALVAVVDGVRDPSRDDDVAALALRWTAAGR